jgi:hypothetical protein
MNWIGVKTSFHVAKESRYQSLLPAIRAILRRINSLLIDAGRYHLATVLVAGIVTFADRVECLVRTVAKAPVNMTTCNWTCYYHHHQTQQACVASVTADDTIVRLLLAMIMMMMSSIDFALLSLIQSDLMTRQDKYVVVVVGADVVETAVADCYCYY